MKAESDNVGEAVVGNAVGVPVVGEIVGAIDGA